MRGPLGKVVLGSVLEGVLGVENHSAPNAQKKKKCFLVMFTELLLSAYVQRARWAGRGVHQKIRKR